MSPLWLDPPCRTSTPVLALDWFGADSPRDFSTRTTAPGRASPPGARLAQGAIGAPGGQSSLYWLTTSSSCLEGYRPRARRKAGQPSAGANPHRSIRLRGEAVQVAVIPDQTVACIEVCPPTFF